MPKKLFLCVAVLPACGLLISPSVASAQNAGNAAAAEALFDAGRKLMAAGNFAEACPKLAASQKLDPGAGTLLNLAACYDKNGQSASAWATYREAASEAKKSGRTDWESNARERAAALEPTLSRLIIVVPEALRLPGLSVERDGVRVDPAEWGIAIPVDPGSHVVSASASQRKPFRRSVSVTGKASRAEVVLDGLQPEASTASPTDAPPASVPPAPPVPVSSDGPSRQSTIGIVLAGAGVFGLGLGSYYGLKAKSTHDDALSHCSADRVCSAQGMDLDDTARGQATVSTISMLGGAALLATGAVLYFTAGSRDTTTVGKSSLRVAMTPSSRGGAMLVGGSF